MDNRSKARLRKIITDYFDDGELRDLCFDLGIDYDDLPGSSTKDKARELVSLCERRFKLADLVTSIRDQRPGVFAGEIMSHAIFSDSGVRNERELSPLDTQKIPTTGRTSQLLQINHDMVRDGFAEMHDQLNDLRELVQRAIELSTTNRLAIIFLVVGVVALTVVMIWMVYILSGLS